MIDVNITYIFIGSQQSTNDSYSPYEVYDSYMQLLLSKIESSDAIYGPCSMLKRVVEPHSSAGSCTEQVQIAAAGHGWHSLN